MVTVLDVNTPMASLLRLKFKVILIPVILVIVAFLHFVISNQYQIKNALSYATRPLWDEADGPKQVIPHYYAEGMRMDSHACQLHGWTEREGKTNIKVFDSVLMSSELDLLEIRMNELDSMVDNFFIIESNATFTGLAKETYFAKNRERFSKFEKKIVYSFLPGYVLAPGQTAWHVESGTRDAMTLLLRNHVHALPSVTRSLVIMSDIDEIPSKHSIDLLKNCEFGESIHLQLRNFLYSSLVSTAWYAGWHVEDQPLSSVSWSKYTVMNYAFALTTPDPGEISVVDSDQILLPQFVTAAHKHNVKASLSIGGWTGSRWFSSNVGSAQNRTAFVKSVAWLVKKYNLDGIDFDWEYPGKQGIGCNVVSPNDTANFLSFLQELRQGLGTGVILTAATDTKPFPDASDAPSADIHALGEVLDYIIIMNYDIRSTPSTGAGPNSPLDDKCAPSDNQFGSAQSALRAWTNAGMPPDRIVLGAPMYGRSYRVPSSAAFADDSNSTLASFPPYILNDQPTGDRWNGHGGLDVCGSYEAPGGSYAFWSLVEESYLNLDGTVKDGISYRYDNCSETPYVYDPKTEIMITYDDARSFAAKGDFVKVNNLRGFAVWEAAGDYNNLLINAILNGTVNGAPRTTKPLLQPSATAMSSASAHRAFSLPATHWILAIGAYYFFG
ncbi:hypothetical protein DXG03_006264 [Asterophora parasitica]|uniref:GH18 domain-containing protein n=1 Tax=Asterophora parasitica TaxID=117018 RepID=A0A9P7G9U6_9AGAR|nr:hypothetical protein DXG03_006264 [Asterophora parasitica]